MFDPNRRPRVPGGVENALREREAYFDPKVGEDEDGFTLADAESLGWNVDLFHATKPFPGRGLIEVSAGGGVLDSNEGRYGVLKAVYDFELGEHQRAKARAREAYGRLVRVERQKLQAPDTKAAIKHTREALALSKELDAFGLLELPDEYVDELREEGSRGLAV